MKKLITMAMVLMMFMITDVRASAGDEFDYTLRIEGNPNTLKNKRFLAVQIKGNETIRESNRN